MILSIAAYGRDAACTKSKIHSIFNRSVYIESLYVLFNAHDVAASIEFFEIFNLMQKDSIAASRWKLGGLKSE